MRQFALLCRLGFGGVDKVEKSRLGFRGLATATPPRVLENGAREATAQENRKWTNTVRPSGLGWGDEDKKAALVF